MSQISVSNRHGYFVTDASTLDKAIQMHLPASPSMLRNRLSDLAYDGQVLDLADVTSVSELLIMLAEFDPDLHAPF